MIIWHRNRRGRGGTTPRCRSRNIANNTFSEGWLQKSNEFAGLRTAPATHHAKNTANTTFSCGMLQNAGFGTIPCGGGGGGSEPRTGIIYIFRERNVFKGRSWTGLFCSEGSLQSYKVKQVSSGWTCSKRFKQPPKAKKCKKNSIVIMDW